LTTIEEEIENIAIDESQTVSAKSIMNDASKRWTFILPGKYLLAITLFYIVNVVKVYFVVSHVDRTVIVPSIYDVSGLLPLKEKLTRLANQSRGILVANRPSLHVRRHG
jgi:hypothetical protein